MSLRSKIARVGAVCAGSVVVSAATVGAVLRGGREGIADSRIAAIALTRVSDLAHPENASGPVAIAGTIGYYAGGFPGALVAGFCTSLGCALLSRLVPDHASKIPPNDGVAR